jgi:hypothetical protein
MTWSLVLDSMDPTYRSDDVMGPSPFLYISIIQCAELMSILFSENGEVIVTLLPVNEKFPWVTPARFRPELVPEELMAPVLTVS